MGEKWLREGCLSPIREGSVLLASCWGQDWARKLQLKCSGSVGKRDSLGERTTSLFLHPFISLKISENSTQQPFMVDENPTRVPSISSSVLFQIGGGAEGEE